MIYYPRTVPAIKNCASIVSPNFLQDITFNYSRPKSVDGAFALYVTFLREPLCPLTSDTFTHMKRPRLCKRMAGADTRRTWWDVSWKIIRRKPCSMFEFLLQDLIEVAESKKPGYEDHVSEDLSSSSKTQNSKKGKRKVFVRIWNIINQNLKQITNMKKLINTFS